MKAELIELYEDALILGEYIKLNDVANGMLPALYPGRGLEDLTDEELITLTKAVITGMTSWVC
ncbi:hypothetical protein [Enterobacter sp. DE0047]|uniref:hypothetical protein n=1 Tax=Enterobacter sp. DE0047 TaxID=2584949 RepID=UPI0011A3C64A|nr:hypothetical protein [Enterobacter sp. DE0047]